MKKIKQINNLVIKQDTVEKISWYGSIKPNPTFGWYIVYGPYGPLEQFDTLPKAEEWCRETKDFLHRK